MSNFTSSAMSAIAIAAALLVTPASAAAESFTMPAPASGISSGNISVDLEGVPSISCSVDIWWDVVNGYIDINGMNGAGSSDCENMLWSSKASVFTAANSTTSGHANIVLFYLNGLAACHAEGTFNNSTQTFTFTDNGTACKLSGSLNFPGVTLAP